MNYNLFLYYFSYDNIYFKISIALDVGAKNLVTNRFIRHFNVIAYPELERETINLIFCKLVTHFFRRHSETIRELVPKLIENIIDVYYKVKTELLPTPSKSHYTFNLRDINRICQGICSGNPKQCSNLRILVRLWYHENMRVFHDRLIDEGDREYIKKILAEFIPNFDISVDEILDVDRIIFADFLQGKDVEPKFY